MLLFNHLLYSAVFTVEFEKKAPPHMDQPIRFHLLKLCLQSWSYHWSRSSSWSHLVLPQHLYHLHILLHKQKKPKDLNWQCWWGTIKNMLAFLWAGRLYGFLVAKRDATITGQVLLFPDLVHYVERTAEQQGKKVVLLLFFPDLHNTARESKVNSGCIFITVHVRKITVKVISKTW